MDFGADSLLWVGFAVVFAVLAVQSALRAKRGLYVRDIDQGFPDMNESYQELKRGIVEADRRSNVTASISFSFGFLAAIGSLVLSVV